MNKFERMQPDSFDASDYASESFYPLLRRVPPALIKPDLREMLENGDSDDAEIESRLRELVEAREELFTDTHVYDSSFSEEVDRQEAFFKTLNSLFSDRESVLGVGTTARVMTTVAVDSTTGKTTPLAIKYLTDPNSMTLSARKESAVLAEVERMKKVEELKSGYGLKHISVPHPYFHHQNTKIECYGMQLIRGFDLEKDFSHIRDRENREKLIETLAAIDIEAVEAEIETFFGKVHDYCLHGDIKEKNIMVDLDGKFYIIDFGQSRLIHELPGDVRDRVDTIREDEINDTKMLIRRLIKKAKSLVTD